MTRTDQMLNVTAAIQGTLLNQGHSNQYAEAFADGFHEGALWADANPQWHKCSEELPEPNVKVLCYTSKGTYFVAWMEEQLIGHNQPTGEYRWSRWNTPIIAWTELPEPPKFD